MKNVFVFPGQGAHVNKIALLKSYDRSYYNDELNIISEAFGFDVLSFGCSANVNTLNSVEYTQLIIFASNIAYLSIARKNNISPDVVAGHSVGQFSAMYAAGCSDLYALAHLIKKRAELMSKVPTVGKLCTVKAPFPIDVEIIKELCCSIQSKSGKVLSVSLYNSYNQIVVGGDVDAISIFMEAVNKRNLGYSCVMLPVGQAFHTALMESMIEPFSQCLEQIPVRDPAIPLILNTTGKRHTTEDLRAELLNHCIKPVMWTQTMEEILKTSGIKIFEVGLGHTLSGFFRNISTNEVITMENRKSFFTATKI